MYKQFQQKLKEFYQKVTLKHENAQFLNRALESYLQFKKGEELKERDSERSSLKSGLSNLSCDSYQQVCKNFSSPSFMTVVLFSYFLHMLHQNRTERINAVLKNVSGLYKKYERQVSIAERKRFAANLMEFNEQLYILNERKVKGCRIEWVYYEVFRDFEGECTLVAQLLSSLGQTLQTVLAVESSLYFNFLATLQIYCQLIDYDKKAYSEFGEGEIKMYLGKKGDLYSVENEKKFQRQKTSQKRSSRDDSSLKELKKYPTEKFKQEFLGEMTRLKQEYDINTKKIASLFSFKDSVDNEQRDI